MCGCYEAENMEEKENIFIVDLLVNLLVMFCQGTGSFLDEIFVYEDLL